MIQLKIAFFASGNGTLFETITKKLQSQEINGQAAVLISSHPEAIAIERAKRLGVPYEIIAQSDYSNRKEFVEKMLQTLSLYHVNFICLAGYLKHIPTELIQKFPRQILNIHPALLPAFGGKGMYGQKVHQAVIESGVRLSGATVHLVDEEYDQGPILVQQAVYVRVDDTAQTLEARVRDVEYRLYPEAVKLFSQNRVQINGRKVTIKTTAEK